MFIGVKCLSVCTSVHPRPHTIKVFFQYCVFSKFGFHIQVLATYVLCGQAQDRERQLQRKMDEQTEARQARQARTSLRAEAQV